MKLLPFIFALMLLPQLMYAQHFKISATQGLGLDPGIKTDSIFFAKNYNATQLRLGYHIGKLGLVLNNTYIRQGSHTDSVVTDDRIPDFLLQASTRRLFGKVNTLNTTLGLELCIPLAKRKAQMNLHAGYGISYSKSDSIGFYDVQVPLYVHQVTRIITGCLQLGAGITYKLNPHLGIKWQNEYNCYRLPYTGIDIRKTPTGDAGNQAKHLFISALGVQYTL